MRKSHKKQLPFSLDRPEHDLSQELRVISDILDRYSILSETALQDISEGRKIDMGASMMSGEQGKVMVSKENFFYCSMIH